MFTFDRHPTQLGPVIGQPDDPRNDPYVELMETGLEPGWSAFMDESSNVKPISGKRIA